MKRLFLLTPSLMIACCGTVPLAPRQVGLALDVPLLTLDLGAGAKVFLRVVDGRSTTTADMNYKFDEVAPILPVGDLSHAIQNSLSNRLSALGYDVVSTEEPSATNLDLTVQVLEYGRYSTKPERLHIDASISIAVYKGETHIIEKGYVRNYEQVGKASEMDQKWLETKVNLMLSQLIEKLLADLELLAALH